MPDNTDKIRTARVTNQVIEPVESLRRTQALLPGNYKAYVNDDGTIVIVGHDVAGWTLDDYVIPRLDSGRIIAKETTES